MTEPIHHDSTSPLTPDAEKHAALFVQLVLQQSNLAMMLLGQTPHPETGKTVRDLDAARLFIDQLEMLEVKTKNNLTPPEAGLLKQTLMSLRLAFVEAVKSPASENPPSASPPAEVQSGATNATADFDESKKRFSKKFEL